MIRVSVLIFLSCLFTYALACGWTRKCGARILQSDWTNRIGTGGCIQSPSGALQFGVASDGMVELCANGTGVWSRGGYTDDHRHLILQSDRNLVLYETGSGDAVWSTATHVRFTDDISTLHITEDAVQLYDHIERKVVWQLRAGRDFKLDTVATPVPEKDNDGLRIVTVGSLTISNPAPLVDNDYHFDATFPVHTQTVSGQTTFSGQKELPRPHAQVW